MARIRTVKPEFWDSPGTAKASLRARLFFIALWNWADDYGKGTASAKALIGFAFPNDADVTESDYPSLATELHSAYEVVFYEVDGRPYFFIPKFTKHQRTEKKAASRIPDPPEDESAGQGHIDEPTVESDGSSDAVDGNSVAGTGEQGNRGTGESFLSDDADAPPDDETDEPPTEVQREDVERVCRHLVEVMVANDCRRPTVTKDWRKHARLMIDKDGREVERIVRAIDWCWQDSFWRGKVESIPKLRTQYDKLRIAAQRGGKSNVHPIDFGGKPTEPKPPSDDMRQGWKR
jgi:hypothetical protein